MSRPLLWLLIASCLAWHGPAAASDPFVVEDIEIVGLQRIPDGTLFNYLPVSIGDELDAARVAQAVRALYATAFFDDVELRRDGSTLIVVVKERPTIALFSISGNREISDEDLRRVLRDVGLTEGRIYNPSVLENVQTELRRQYFSRGRYGMQVDTRVRELANNTVSITVTIREGLVARIRDISFVGNEVFSDDRLQRELESSTRNWLSWLRGDDQYSREKLQGDLETLRSFYMDRGYASFMVHSTQVAISPDKKEVYITINLEEGALYTIGDITFVGNLIVPEEELKALLTVERGSTFSLGAITQSIEWMTMRLGLEGYAYAEVTPLPEVDTETKTVGLTLHVQPGSRVYVRRIEFSGNPGTNDETYRREMRQLEGAWLQSGAIERSRIRLQRLPFVERVEIDTTPVPGTEDLVDIDIDITERNPGDFNFGIGYSSAFGMMLNTGLTHTNFLGRGQRVQLELGRSQFDESYSVSFTEPYLTANGVSATAVLFYRSMDSLFVRSSPFVMNSYGGSFLFGLPISEYNRVNVGFSLRETEMIASLLSSDQMRAWVTNPNHGRRYTIEEEDFLNPGEMVEVAWGTEFRTFELLAGFVTDTRDRVIFASSGTRREYHMEVTLPFSDVNYVTGRISNESYFRINDNLTLMARAGISAGRALGGAQSIPPYKHFFGGGPDTVRGYREMWLGPRDSFERPFGGNILTFGQVELILPPPFEGMRDNARISVFYDVGNVFSGRNNINLGQMRMSAGLAVTWLAPIGALKFSLAFPFRDHPNDETEKFQFSIGSAF